MRWKPDTCECVVGVTFTDTGILLNEGFSYKCPIHALYKDNDECLNRVWSENRAKNRAVNEYAAATGMRPEDVLFSFDANRNVQVKGR